MNKNSKLLWQKKISNKVIPVHILVNETTETFCFFDTVYDGNTLDKDFKEYRDKLAEYLMNFVKIYKEKNNKLNKHKIIVTN